MRIVKIIIRNFMSFKKLEYTFEYGEPILIFGKNGAGKSTIIEALVWCVWGKGIRSIDADYMLRDNYGKDCEVITEIERDNQYGGDVLIIERYRNHSIYGNRLNVKTNDEESEKDMEEAYRRNADAQGFINDFLGMDYNTFLNTVIFGQGAGKFFAQSTEPERKKIFDDILNLGVWKVHQEKAKKFLASLREKISAASIARGELSVRIMKFSDLMDEHKEKASNILQEELDRKQKSYEEAGASLLAIKTALETLEEDETILTLKKEFDVLRERELRAKEYLSERRFALRDLLARIAKSKAQIDSPEIIVGAQCPVCKTAITESTLKNYIGHLECRYGSDDKSRIFIEAEIKRKEEELKRWQEEMKKVEEGMEGAERERQSLEMRRAGLNVTTTSLYRDIKEIRNKIKDIDTDDNFDAESIKKAIGEAQEEIDEIDVAVDKLKRKEPYYSFWVEAFSDRGIKNYILNDVMDFVNDRVNYYLGIFSDGCLSVKIDTISTLKKSDQVRDKISIYVNDNGKEKKYERYSGGEKRKIDLSIMLGLQDLSDSSGKRRFDMFLADEVFDWLDDAGTNNAVQILEEIAKRGDAVYVITHNDELKGKFSKSIEVVKERNRSRLIA